MTLRCANLREELHTELERMLNDIIRFKIHIQGSLEGYEEFVAGEVDREWEEQAAAMNDEAVSSAAGNGDEMDE